MGGKVTFRSQLGVHSMRHLICFVAGTLIVCALSAGGQNLLVNSSFETGNLSGWTVLNNSAFVATDGTSLAGGGSGSVLNTHTGSFAMYGPSIPTISQNVTVAPGASYAAGYYASKGNNQGGTAQSGSTSITIDGVSHRLTLTIPIGASATNFARVQQFYTAPAGETSATVTFAPETAYASFDDFFFQPYVPKTYSAGNTTRMLISGDPMPGNPASTLSTGISYPLLNDHGQIVVNTLTNLSPVQYGLISTDGLSPRAVVGANQLSPDGNGVFSDVNAHAINASGQTVFDASFSNTTGGTTDNFGLFLDNGTSLITLARKGQAAPDGNGTIASAATIAFNDQGKTLIFETLSGTVGPNDSQALYLHDGSHAIKLARAGDLTPSGNYKIQSVSNIAPACINNLGQVVFNVQMTPVAGGSAVTGLFYFDGTATIELPRSGQTLDNQAWTNFGQLSLTDSGKIVFNGKIGSTTGVLVRDGDAVSVIAQLGKTAPDGNGKFSVFSESATASASAQIAILATLTGTTGGTTDNSGIYRAGLDGMIKVARAGQMTPENDGTFTVFDPKPSISPTGAVAFVAQNSTSGNDAEVGIYVGDGRDLLMVVRYGYVVDGAIADTSSPTDRVPPAINALGQVAYRRTLSDGRQRILLWTPTLHWRAGVSGDWSNSDNWTLGLAPAAPHPVVIDPVASTTVAGPAGVTAIQSLTLGGVGSAKLGLAPGSNLMVSGDATVNTTGKLGVHLAGNGFDSVTRQYSRLSVGGNAALSGTLDVTRAAGFTPQLGDTFDVLTYSTHTGQFNSITGVDAGANLALAAVYLPDRLEIVAALPGDANLDHSVGFSDLVTVAQHYGASGQSWVTGDFTGDGVVAFEDLVKVAQNYGGLFPPVAVAGASADFQADMAAAFASVPEPAGLVIVLFVMPLLRRRR
jgi:hypothetical protein